MTWFRVGGAGIPASLMNAMNAVLNKKFGTSGQNYPPNGWPNNVNLMGPLPIKTASGEIVTFADGADDVPVQSCVCGIFASGGGGSPSSPVSIVGYSGLTVTRTDGQTPPVASDNYAFSWSDTAGTVYGGELNVTTGVLSVKYKAVTFDGSSDENWGNYSNYNGYYINIPDMKQGTRQDGLCNILTLSKGTAQGQTNAFWVGAGNTRIYVIGVYDSMGATVEAFRTFLSNTNMIIVYPLATALTYQLTPVQINTLLGSNKIYTDITGATNSVSYRADIDLLLAALQGSRSLSSSLMRSGGPDLEERSEDPEEVSEPEENFQNTEEQEGENDER